MPQSWCEASSRCAALFGLGPVSSVLYVVTCVLRGGESDEDGLSERVRVGAFAIASAGGGSICDRGDGGGVRGVVSWACRR